MRSRYGAAVVAAAGEYECMPEAIAELECIRAGAVVELAQRRSGNGGYSALEREEWLTEHSFQSHDMDTAVETWKAYFRGPSFSRQVEMRCARRDGQARSQSDRSPARAGCLEEAHARLLRPQRVSNALHDASDVGPERRGCARTHADQTSKRVTWHAWLYPASGGAHPVGPWRRERQSQLR